MSQVRDDSNEGDAAKQEGPLGESVKIYTQFCAAI
jgi:hypothetical protein